MPRGDRTGPMGLGSGTGWGRGLCSGLGAPSINYGGRGRGFGRGFGFRRFGGALSVSPADDVSLLKRQISTMEDELSAAKKYLSEIQAEKE
jgi:hypothetical protein